MTFDSRLLSGIGVLSAVIEAGSFLRAGQALGLTQSAVSRAVARLEQRLSVEVCELVEVEVDADADQLEQALINLCKNAAEAALETAGGVRIRLQREPGNAIVEIEDDGPGLAKTENLFVPFFTTKPGGSGVGLVLARQIVENHGGGLSLGNREGARGCVVRVTLPI